MPDMPGAYIRGMGLCCALGEDVAQSLAAMRARHTTPIGLQLDDFHEPVRMQYFRVPDRAELFDATRFERLLSRVVRAAVSQAGLTDAELRGLPLFIGSSCFSIWQSEADYALALRERPAAAIPMPICGYQDIDVITRQTLNCDGDTYTYNTACTSSANAVLAAVRMLESGWYSHALVIGAELVNRTTLAGFAGLQLVADSIRPFAADRQGIVLGEGFGAVVLAAQSDPDTSLRVLGGASNCDTSSVTTANPDGSSVRAVLQQALASVRLEADQIQGVKAHGTATPSGDTAEALGMRQVFAQIPPVSVLKPYLGHTLGGCGVNELILFAQALQQGFLPAAPVYGDPDPALGIQPLSDERVAASGAYLLNYFGFGGNNTVLALEKGAS